MDPDCFHSFLGLLLLNQKMETQVSLINTKQLFLKSHATSSSRWRGVCVSSIWKNQFFCFIFRLMFLKTDLNSYKLTSSNLFENWFSFLMNFRLFCSTQFHQAKLKRGILNSHLKYWIPCDSRQSTKLHDHCSSTGCASVWLTACPWWWMMDAIPQVYL